MTFTITPRQQQDFQKTMENIANEAVTVEHINETYYVAASETAVLRIFSRYYKSDKARFFFSEPQQTWMFALDTPNFVS